MERVPALSPWAHIWVMIGRTSALVTLPALLTVSVGRLIPLPRSVSYRAARPSRSSAFIRTSTAAVWPDWIVPLTSMNWALIAILPASMADVVGALTAGLSAMLPVFESDLLGTVGKT